MLPQKKETDSTDNMDCIEITIQTITGTNSTDQGGHNVQQDLPCNQLMVDHYLTIKPIQ